jgi:hypothetical protein
MKVAVGRRKNALGKIFRAAVPLVAATQWEGQQEGPEELEPESEPP